VTDEAKLAEACKAIKNGHKTGANFKLMREVLSLSAAELASMLDVAPETVSRWETGAHTIKPATWTILATLVLERTEGRGKMAGILKAMKEPKPPGEIYVKSKRGGGFSYSWPPVSYLRSCIFCRRELESECKRMECLEALQ
jgi:DNA-binding transcriptional regulator YiaG